MRIDSVASVALASGIVEQVVAGPVAYHHNATISSEAHIQIETDPEGIKWPWRSYKSSPHTPPFANITTNGKPLSDGYTFITPKDINNSNATKQSAGFILTTEGDLVYAVDVSGLTDFRKQYWNNKPYLTYWSGYNSNGANTGHGYGQVNFLDENYESFAFSPNLHLNQGPGTPSNGSIDIHEHQITPQNTILVSTYNNTQWDLTSVNGSADGWIVDSVIFELNVTTQEILFEWRASDHLSLSASHQPLISGSGNGTEAAPWDWFHVNAIQRVGDDYLINSRHHWAVYLVSRKNGSVIWTLEGESGGSFGKLPSDGTFRWQHDTRIHNATATSVDLSLFDNHNQALNNGTGSTKAIVYHLELPASKDDIPQLTRRLETPSQLLYADSQGSYSADLENGNQFVGYGQLSISREYGPATDGSDLRWQAQFGGLNEVQSYRGFKQTWSATPKSWDPTLVVEDGKAYVSWNGATEVKQWAVYTGKDSTALSRVGVVDRKGFETVFDIPETADVIQVTAIQHGHEVRKSNVEQSGVEVTR